MRSLPERRIEVMTVSPPAIFRRSATVLSTTADSRDHLGLDRIVLDVERLVERAALACPLRQDPVEQDEEEDSPPPSASGRPA